MRRPWHGAMPVTLSLPLDLGRRLSSRQRRWRRVAVGALIGLGLALLAAGFWLPARGDTVPRAHFALPRDGGGALTVPAARVATLAIGDELVVERPDGSTSTYAVTALDVVDSQRADLDAGEGIVVLVAPWPFEAVTVGGSWRYVVTARRRF